MVQVCAHQVHRGHRVTCRNDVENRAMVVVDALPEALRRVVTPESAGQDAEYRSGDEFEQWILGSAQ